MQFAVPKLRTWHLFGLIAAAGAVLAVGRFRHDVDNPVRPVLREIHFGNAAERVKAAEELARSRDPSAEVIDALTGALHDADTRVRERAAQSLFWCTPADPADPRAQSVRSAMSLAIGDSSEIVQHWAVIALAQLDKPTGSLVPRLLKATRAPDREIRARAISSPGLEALAREDTNARQALIAGLSDQSNLVRKWAVEHLAFSAFYRKGFDRDWARTPGPPALLEALTPELVRASHDPDPIVRVEAARALSRLGLAQYRLIEMVDDPDKIVRARAAGSIGRPATKSLPVLIRALKSDDPGLRTAAASAAGRLGVDAEDALPAISAALRGLEPWRQREVIEARDTIQKAVKNFYERILPDLIAGLDDSDPDVRRSVAVQIGERGHVARTAVPALMARLSDDDPAVRTAAAYALGNIGVDAASALPALGARRRDGEPNVREAIRAAIGAIQTETRQIPAER